MEANNLISYLNKLSEAKLRLMEEILSITEEQASCTNEEEIDRMAELIQLKQQVIDKINVLDKEFIDKFNSLKGLLSINTLDEIDMSKYKEMKDLKYSIGQIYVEVEKIQHVEAENSINMQKAFENVKRELSQVKNSARINNVYTKNKKIYGGVFIDKRK